ncbi:hypothetical protein PFISCL1PPCAC_4966, partial [Pristionchus fissidentatus]
LQQLQPIAARSVQQPTAVQQPNQVLQNVVQVPPLQQQLQHSIPQVQQPIATQSVQPAPVAVQRPVQQPFIVTQSSQPAQVVVQSTATPTPSPTVR